MFQPTFDQGIPVLKTFDASEVSVQYNQRGVVLLGPDTNIFSDTIWVSIETHLDTWKNWREQIDAFHSQHHYDELQLWHHGSEVHPDGHDLLRLIDDNILGVLDRALNIPMLAANSLNAHSMSAGHFIGLHDHMAPKRVTVCMYPKSQDTFNSQRSDPNSCALMLANEHQQETRVEIPGRSIAIFNPKKKKWLNILGVLLERT